MLFMGLYWFYFLLMPKYFWFTWLRLSLWWQVFHRVRWYFQTQFPGHLFTRNRIMSALYYFENLTLIVLYVLNISVNNSFWGLSQEFILKTMVTETFYDRGSLSVCVQVYEKSCTWEITWNGEHEQHHYWWVLRPGRTAHVEQQYWFDH